jgi:DMSO/TMAO reductase YedYZ molybdopterin-dependent catalytic subunit
MNTRLVITVLIAALAVIVILALFFIGPFQGRAQNAAPTSVAEVRTFQGQDLSSINDFRENAINGVQHVNISTYQLTVTGLTNRTVTYSYNQVLTQFPHYSKVETLHCVEGWDVTILWQGVLVRDLLNDAGIDPRANTVILTGTDGYTTSFPLSYFTQNDILMAYNINNVTLPAERGYPFQLVAENKWGYKWIKWIDQIQLTDDPTYQGYWEQRGYSESGDLNQSFSSI